MDAEGAQAMVEAYLSENVFPVLQSRGYELKSRPEPGVLQSMLRGIRDFVEETVVIDVPKQVRQRDIPQLEYRMRKKEGRGYSESELTVDIVVEMNQPSGSPHIKLNGRRDGSWCVVTRREVDTYQPERSIENFLYEFEHRPR